MNRTGPERESDTLCDTLKEEVFTKSLKILEASTGIEPVYTDLQSRKSVSENNDLRVQNTP